MTVPRILGVAVAYYAGTRVGTLKGVTRLDGVDVSPLWPATGIALAALLLLGTGVWPGITLGTFGSVATLGPFGPSNVAILAGNTVAPLCSWLLLRRVGFRVQLDRLRDGMALVFLGALTGILISSTVGAGALALSGTLPLGFWPTWLAWWTGDAMGVLLVTPFLLVLCRIRLPLPTHRWAESAAIVVAAVVITPLAVTRSLTLVFLFFPVLIWAALRFELAASAPYALFVSVVAILEAAKDIGAFAHYSLMERLFSLQVLNGSVALTSLLLAATITEQNKLRQGIEEACEALAKVVKEIAPEKTRLWPPDRTQRP
ncbi:MASE1 domain-containing protein [Streptomyces sp. NPDC050804]|uniref:MASE1 domain-containing protein n=1 Tax=unclassified Streptomyces TaxID=2593676 RepID=UPI0034178B3B|nr:MASE1 domain-containing protein [Streptomyces sp. NBC_00872]